MTDYGEPLEYIESTTEIVDREGNNVADVYKPDMGRRIVAAVNAVRGIPTEALENAKMTISIDGRVGGGHVVTYTLKAEGSGDD